MTRLSNKGYPTSNQENELYFLNGIPIIIDVSNIGKEPDSWLSGDC